ncbi:MAG: hypothetical protein FWB76_03670 [Oscillospiraceae bacterium]|nr:hypothetical protein [Oscillospiraceae bacterium]
MKLRIPTNQLKTVYNIIDWVDLGLVGLIIWYYSRLFGGLDVSLITEFDFSTYTRMMVDNATALGVVLLLASLAICAVFIYLTIHMRRARQISAARTVVRLAWNLIWIPFDLYFLFLIFTR